VLVILAASPTTGRAGDSTAIRFSELYASSGPLGLSFSPAATRLHGRPVRMRGYMAPPLKAEARFFVLSAQPVAVCPFCQSDADWPEDIVVVYVGSGGWRFSSGAERVEVSGLLDLGAKLDPDTGFVSQVRLIGATVRTD
jgi:hypothetical protein